MRLLLSTLAVLFFLLAVPDAAEAEEMFVLDDGVVLRGYVMREEDGGERLVIRLAGFRSVNTVTVEARRIVRRHVLRRPGAQPAAPAAPADVLYTPRPAPAPSSTAPVRPAPSGSIPRSTAPMPTAAAEEPAPKNEVFFVRLAEVAKLAVPKDPTSRIVLGFMVFLVLCVLVNLGGRLADLQTPTLGTTCALAALLVSILVADIFYAEYFLTGHRALWVIPSQVLGWILASRVMLGGPMARNFLLTGFVLFSMLTFCFVTGAVLVTI